MQRSRHFLRILAFLFILASLGIVRLPLASWVHEIGGTGLRGDLMWMGAMAVAAVLPIPSEPIMTASLQTNGLVVGTLNDLCGVMLGALLLFGVGRLAAGVVDAAFARPPFSTWRLRAETALADGRFWVLVALQLLPIPFLVVNLLLGALREVKFWPFLFASLLGFAPYQIVWALLFIGWKHAGVWWQFALVILLALGVYLWLHRFGRRQKARRQAER
ncbi:TVP38/TMEM64 family protein [Alicyclobacillus fodiniaquatilis]|uniref:TVP38/TMEM64 family membrane protein n=1 Tax=Alicyclobacillus fodiniaquatilis TaxID=1661150 RepID=A0ABW4JDH1_9BACL